MINRIKAHMDWNRIGATQDAVWKYKMDSMKARLSLTLL